MMEEVCDINSKGKKTKDPVAVQSNELIVLMNKNNHIIEEREQKKRGLVTRDEMFSESDKYIKIVNDYIKSGNLDIELVVNDDED